MIKQNTAKYVTRKRSSDKQIQTSKNPLLSVAQKSSASAHVKLGMNVIDKLLTEIIMKKCKAVSEIAENFGTDWAWSAGLWHDLGKYLTCLSRIY